jgi:hypothetical protein
MDTTSRYDRMPGSGGTLINDAPAVIAAVFADRDSAHGAAHQLHEEGFRDTWIGLTRTADSANYSVYERPEREAGETRVEADNWFMRFFGEGDQSLFDALERHGVSREDADAAGTLPPHSAILTVDGANHPELAAQLIRQCGGQVLTRGFGATGYGTAGQFAMGSDAPVVAAAGANTAAAAAWSSPRARTTSLNDDGVLDDRSRGVAATDDDYGRYRAGVPLDEATRMQLRQERLRVDRAPISNADTQAGVAGTTPMSGAEIPSVREEIFTERVRSDWSSEATK